MKSTKILIICVLALASTVHAAQSLTVNGDPCDSIVLELGQSRTIEVVSDDNSSYVAYVGFDSGLVLGNFSHVETKSEAGSVASAVEHNEPAFYGYLCVAAGGPSAGVHFVFQYEALQLGETVLKLYQNNPPPSAGPLLDSVHITVIPLQPKPMGTAFTYQGRLMDANKPADGLYDFEFKLYDNPGPFAAQLGSTIDVNELDVIDGYFTVGLDFNDANAFNGDARWLQIGVRPGEMNDPNGYTPLSPRQEVTPTSYALYAKTAGSDNDWMVSGNDMYSIPSGNVGIGTSSPSALLDVAGNAEFAGDVMLREKYRVSTRAVGDSTDYLHIERDWGGWQNGIYLHRQFGNVGIGTTSPAYKLDVFGDIHATGTIYGTADNADKVDGYHYSPSWPTTLANIQGACSNNFHNIGGIDDDVPDSDVEVPDYISINNGRLYAPAGAASVGIGTTSPAQKLDVAGNVTASRYYDRNNPAYYVDPASTSYCNDMRANIFYDRSNTAYYVDPAGTSICNTMRASIFYDRDNTGYYVNPASTSSLYNVRAWDGSATINYATGAGELYVEHDLEVDGDVYMLKLHNTQVGTGRSVYVNGNTGRLGYLISSKRYKENIAPLQDDFAKILGAQAVTFTYKQTKERGIGLIAEDLDELGLSDLVIYDTEGRPESVRYEFVSLYLLEVLKDQANSIKELKAENESLKEQLRAENQSVKQRLNALEKIMRQQQFANGKEF